MKKKIYNPLEMEVLPFDTEDIVTTSGDTDVGEGELGYVPDIEIGF